VILQVLGGHHVVQRKANTSQFARKVFRLSLRSRSDGAVDF
jgi:hypothetical protein